MRRAPLVLLAAGALILALRPVPVRAADGATPSAGLAAAKDGNVPLYTNEDLDRMFGPPSPDPTGPVDKTTPADWAWVEQFLDRQYARIDADRRYDLDRRSEGLSYPAAPSYFGYPVAWSLGYPASVWWNRVYGSYRAGLRSPAPTQPRSPSSRPIARAPRAGGGSLRGGGHAGIHHGGARGTR